jgi:hypothetical protein
VQEKHCLGELFGSLLLSVLKDKPADPLQFIIDTLSLGPELAAQVCLLVQMLFDFCNCFSRVA